MQDTETIAVVNPAEAEGTEEEQVGHKIKWTGFVETTLVDFFSAYKLEKLQVEDGNGNKAKLSLTKDNGIKIELSSVSII